MGTKEKLVEETRKSGGSDSENEGAEIGPGEGYAVSKI